MRVYIGADHAGFEMKQAIAEHLRQAGHEVTDVGTTGNESVDYPDFAVQVGRAVARGDAERGVLVCGTGVGMAIAANKVRGVRAAAIENPEIAKMARRHNDLNVLAVSGRYTDLATATEVVDTFLSEPFEGGRHQGRVGKIADIEAKERP